MTFFRKYLPFISIGIGMSAIAFQVIYLYPWHQELQEKFRKAQIQQQLKVQAYDEAKLQKIVTLQKKMTQLTELLDQSKLLVNKVVAQKHH